MEPVNNYAFPGGITYFDAVVRVVLFGQGPTADAVADAIQRFGEAVNDPHVSLTRVSGGLGFVSDDHLMDLVIVAGFSGGVERLILPSICGTWICHAGPVPSYRGPDPINRQILDGRKQIGISLLLDDGSGDGGPVIGQGEFDLLLGDTLADACAQADRLFGELVTAALKRFVACRRDGTLFQVNPQSAPLPPVKERQSRVWLA